MYTLLVRPGCHLCEQAQQSLTSLGMDIGIDYQIVDIDSSDDYRQHSWDVPVLLDDSGKVRAKLTASPAALKRAMRTSWWKR